jgi:hypothetical protein
MAMKIRYLTPLERINPENDNVDVHVTLADGRIYSAPIFVRLLTSEYVSQAIEAIFRENDGHWLTVYGTLQR